MLLSLLQSAAAAAAAVGASAAAGAPVCAAIGSGLLGRRVQSGRTGELLPGDTVGQRGRCRTGFLLLCFREAHGNRTE